jgi:DNA-binding SARP family transcriptional activator
VTSFGRLLRVRVMLLGPVVACSDTGEPIDVPGVRLRMLLARLALEPGRPVSTDALVDGLWGEQVPAGAAGALQALVSRLRKALGAAATIELAPGGYRLRLRNEDVDASRFEELAEKGRRELAAGRLAAAASTLGDAATRRRCGAAGRWLTCWRRHSLALRPPG